MKIGITVLKDFDGVHYVLADGKPCKLDDIGAQKLALKDAAGAGLRLGKRAFASGMVLSQYGVEARKTFPLVTAPPVQA